MANILIGAVGVFQTQMSGVVQDVRDQCGVASNRLSERGLATSARSLPDPPGRGVVDGPDVDHGVTETGSGRLFEIP